MMALWSLFRRRKQAEKPRQEPILVDAATALPDVFDFDDYPAVAAKPLALPAPHYIHPYPFDFRAISPRQFADRVHELYLEGELKWQEYQLIGQPSELRRDYNNTIGALTGERAQPDRPRDMLAEWEQRLRFFRRFSDANVPVAERAVDVLRRYSSPSSTLSAAE